MHTKEDFILSWGVVTDIKNYMSMLLFEKSWNNMEKKIKTKNFVLRPIGINDAKNIYLFQQDAEAKKNLAWIPDSIERVKKDIIAELKKKYRETLVIDVEGQAVGGITLSMIIPNHKGNWGSG